MPRHSEATLATIKNTVDIVTLVGDYLPLHRAGSKYKCLCPFHDDHNPSMEVNPDRQQFKCWPCGAGGDIFDFVQMIERVEFPEALRMLAERAGVSLDAPKGASSGAGVGRAEILAALMWAEEQFVEALEGSLESKNYLTSRGISESSAARFRLGYAPEGRDWLTTKAKRQGLSQEVLERAGLVVKQTEPPHSVHERFRGRLMFPIRDPRGRVLGFGGRVLPSVEKSMAERGMNVAKYLNSPETAVFQKRRLVYAADLARASAREAKWVAVVEGYTDVIAAHQVGLTNVVGTLGTALGDDHVVALRRMADRVVLVFDGDTAGQNATDKALELFLGHEVDVRVLALPGGLDPCDYLLDRGAEPFRELVHSASDPLEFAVRRAEARYDLNSLEGSRQAAEWVLSILGRVPVQNRAGLDVKLAKALDSLSHRLGVPVADLKRRLRQVRREVAQPARVVPIEIATTETSALGSTDPLDATATTAPPVEFVHVGDLDPLERELVEIALADPTAVDAMSSRVPAWSLNHPALKAILQACYDLKREGITPSFDRVSLRLDENIAAKTLAAELVMPGDPGPLTSDPAPWPLRLTGALKSLETRERKARLKDVFAAVLNHDGKSEPSDNRSLYAEAMRLKSQQFRPSGPIPSPTGPAPFSQP